MMEQPPLTDAPLGWLEAVVEDLSNESNEKALDIRIKSVEDETHYTFTCTLGDIRTELHRRTTN